MPDTEGHLLKDSVYEKCPEQANPWRQTADGRLPEPGGEEGQEAACSMGTGFSAEVMKCSGT